MPEICVKSFAFQYEMQFIKEIKYYNIPATIYNNIVTEIHEDPINIADYVFDVELNYSLRFPNCYSCGEGDWCKWGSKLKEDKTLKLILSNLCKSGTWRNHYLHVYWDIHKNILTFEEEYGDKYEN